MIRNAITLFCLCCVVLCAFVGYLSFNSLQESDKAIAEPVETKCEDILADVPTVTSRIVLTNFIPGKYLAHFDTNADEKWDSLCVPFFPQRDHRVGQSYSAVLVYFKDVPDREALEKLLDERDGLDTNFWPLRQNLDRATHSLLAQKYKNLNFAKSPVLRYGFETENPVLGETTLVASAAAGSLALLVGFISMISVFFVRKPSLRQPSTTKIPQEAEAAKPLTNRAGLPTKDDSNPEKIDDSENSGNGKSIFDIEAQSGSIFDRVTSLRS